MREAISTYSLVDIFIELAIQPPQNCPQGSISVESGRRVGVAVRRWRNWKPLQLYLTHQVTTKKQIKQTHKQNHAKHEFTNCLQRQYLFLLLRWAVPDDSLWNVCSSGIMDCCGRITWTNDLRKLHDLLLRHPRPSDTRSLRRAPAKRSSTSRLLRAHGLWLFFYPQSSCWDYKMPETTVCSSNVCIVLCACRHSSEGPGVQNTIHGTCVDLTLSTWEMKAKIYVQLKK